jgi:hypothetical protein
MEESIKTIIINSVSDTLSKTLTPLVLNDWIISITGGIMAGLISGIVVYYILKSVEDRKWERCKKELINNFNNDLSRIITAVRVFLHIGMILKISKDIEYVDFISKNIIQKYESIKKQAEYSDEKSFKNFRINMIDGMNELKYTNIILMNFKASDPWYLESILQIQERIQKVLIPYIVVPEIYDKKFNQEKEIISWRHIASKELLALCERILEIKTNKNITKYVKDE